MTRAEQIAEDVMQFLAGRAWLTTGTREDLRRLVLEKVAPLIPSWQGSLFSADEERLAGQSAAILKLLKERRSSGATNAELAAISLKYTARISDLRKQGYRIFAKQISGGTWQYNLSPEMW